MMDHALSRLEEAREEMRELADLLRHARLEAFQRGLLRAHLSMWAQPDQWRLLSLRIVMGKLMAVAFPIVLQSPHWTASYQKSWGSLYQTVVADHMWLHTAGFCPHVPAITKGFQHMQVMWVKYRPNGWRLEDDFMFPEGKATAPAPPSPPFTPHRSANKKSKAVPILRADGTIDPFQAVPRGAPRGRGRGDHSTGLVEPAGHIPSGRGNGKNKDQNNGAEEAVAGTTDEARPPSAAEEHTEAGPSPIDGPPPSAGPYPTAAKHPAATASTIMLDRPMPVGFSPRGAPGLAASPLAHRAPAAPAWAWPQAQQPPKLPPPPPFAPGFPPGSPPSSSSSSSNRPSSSGQLSAKAEPFTPGARAAATEPSAGGCSSSSAANSRRSSPVLGSPAPGRMSGLYVAYDGQDESAVGKGEGIESTGGLDTATA